MPKGTTEPLPYGCNSGELALQLCKEIRKKKRLKWYTPAAMMCWGVQRVLDVLQVWFGEEML